RAKTEVLQKANEFCNKKGLIVETLEVNTIPAAPGRLGSTDLRFRCISTSANAQKLPTPVIRLMQR
ncbi:MAG: hypothetical protein DSZ04_01460, partial [Sulfurimonas sp.]